MRRLRTTSSILCLLALAACDDGGSDDSSCTFNVAVSGDVSAQLPGPMGVACLIAHSFEEDIDVDFAPIDLPVDSVGLLIQTITEGATGEFPATLRVRDNAGHSWQNDACTVSVTEHSFEADVELGNKRYRVRGSGSCPAPLVDDAAGSVTLAPFEFSTSAIWSQ